MAQSALTVTAPNPTPPTNLSFVGATPPMDLAQTVADDGIALAVPNSVNNGAANGNTLNEPSGSLNVYAAKTAAAGSGTSVDHEGKGNETLFTQTYGSNIYAPIVLKMDGCGPAYSANPNTNHASSLSPATNPALVSISPTTTVSGAGTQLLTCTGTNFVPGCRIRVNGVDQDTTFVSATSITATVKKSNVATTWPVVVTLAGVPVGVTATWTFT